MPRVTIELVEGRTVEMRRQMAKEITDSIVRITSCAPDSVSIYFCEMKADQFSKAGKLRCD